MQIRPFGRLPAVLTALTLLIGSAGTNPAAAAESAIAPPPTRILPFPGHCPDFLQVISRTDLLLTTNLRCSLLADDALFALVHAMAQRETDGKVVVATETVYEGADVGQFQEADPDDETFLPRFRITRAPCFIAPIEVAGDRWSAADQGLRHIARTVTFADLFTSRCHPPPGIWGPELATDAVLWRLVVISLEELRRIASQLQRIEQEQKRLADLFGAAEVVDLIDNPYLERFNRQETLYRHALEMAEAARVFLVNAAQWSLRSREDAFGQAILDRWHRTLAAETDSFLSVHAVPTAAPAAPALSGASGRSTAAPAAGPAGAPVAAGTSGAAAPPPVPTPRRLPPTVGTPVSEAAEAAPGPPRPFADFGSLLGPTPEERIAALTAILRTPILTDDLEAYRNVGG